MYTLHVLASKIETELYGVVALCFWCAQCSVAIVMPQSPAPPRRGPPAPVLAEASGSTSAFDVGCDVEGGPAEERQALWELVSLVTEVIPDVFSHRHMKLLTLGLRAKVRPTTT